MKEIRIARSTGATQANKIVAEFGVSPDEGYKDIRIPSASALIREDVPGTQPEPVFDSAIQADIQGNVIPGFNKDHQAFLFFQFSRIKDCRTFLKWLVPHLSSMDEVVAFRKVFRALRFKHGRQYSNLCATWINVGFSSVGLAKLTSKDDVAKFGDESFRQGLAARSSFLGDPTDPANLGHAKNWVVGGPKQEADLVVIVASDSSTELERFVEIIKGKAVDGHLKLIHDQRGENLPGDLRGHEHFGFRDGISQPGIRGKLSTLPGDYITPRYIAHTDERSKYFAKPGQQLVWPGQFLLGEKRQSAEDLAEPLSESLAFPAWANRGSFLVIRRLRQDVPMFWKFVCAAASKVGIDSQKFASMLVGRWPSGAPLLRSPTADDPHLAEDDFANNHFIYDDDTRPSQLHPIPGYPGDTHTNAKADFLAQVCPHFAHIRKVNPRDTATEMGKPHDSVTRHLLRRGIPFGRPLIGVKRPSKSLRECERGLMFVSYSSSIENQFEFIQRRWSNSAVQPNLGGYDPIIGANGSPPNRERFIDFPTPSGQIRIHFEDEWVVPTGGGYFFAPTISSIKDVLAS